MAMKLGILTTAFGLPLGFILIPAYGVLGVIIAGLISGIPSMIWGLYWVWKHYGAKADFRSSAKILAASTVAAVPAFLATTLFRERFEQTFKHHLSLALKTFHHIAPMIHAHTGQILVTYTSVPRYEPWLELALSLIIFLTVYIFGAPLIGAMSQSDIETIRDMFSGLGIVSGVINIPLNAAERAAQTKTTKKQQK